MEIGLLQNIHFAANLSPDKQIETAIWHNRRIQRSLYPAAFFYLVKIGNDIILKIECVAVFQSNVIEALAAEGILVCIHGKPGTAIVFHISNMAIDILNKDDFERELEELGSLRAKADAITS